MELLDTKKIWDYSLVRYSKEEQFQVSKETTEEPETSLPAEGSQKRNLQQIPISYKQLQEYGYCVISTQKYDSEGHSKYEIAPISTQLTFLEKELQYKRKLTGLPEFLKIYIARQGSKTAICTLVSERFGKKKVEWQGTIQLNI